MRTLTLLFLLLPILSNGQTSKLDSLWNAWTDESNPDTLRYEALHGYNWGGPLFSSPDSALLIAEMQMQFATERNLPKQKAGAYNTLGVVYYLKGDYGIAIDYYSKSKDAHEAAGNRKGVASTITNIGIIYSLQDEQELALDYHLRSLEIRLEVGDERGLAPAYNNIGTVLFNLGQIDTAEYYYERSLEYSIAHNHKRAIISNHINLGKICLERKTYAEAKDHFSKSLLFAEEMDIKSDIAVAHSNLADMYEEMGEPALAKKHARASLKIAQENDVKEEVKDASEVLYEVYKAEGDYQAALTAYEIHNEAKDSINSQTNRNQVLSNRFKVAYEKKAAADSVRTAEEKKVSDAILAAERAENAKKDQQQYFLYGGLALALLFGAFIFNRFRVTSKQKGIIETQKEKVDAAYDELEIKNQEIMDSITYAKRIQSAILPPDQLVKEYLKESFILYKPKDIVAGDFYWMIPLDTGILFAAADCTGHGVPGAMVSVVCNNALNRSVREFGLTEPGRILDKTREIVVAEFRASGHTGTMENVKDGMDIALCHLSGNTLQFAGAYNPLWIVRNGEILETKGTKQAVGVVDQPVPFTTHTLELLPGDALYIFSDGFVDQFGGEKGKKFKARALRELLLSIQSLPMPEQRSRIDQTFETWKGELEQVDDVCFIGVKV